MPRQPAKVVQLPTHLIIHFIQLVVRELEGGESIFGLSFPFRREEGQRAGGSTKLVSWTAYQPT